MDPLSLFMAKMATNKLIGSQQLGPKAPAPMLGGGMGVGDLSQMAQQNNFGQGGMIGGLPEPSTPPPPAMPTMPTAEGPGGLEKYFGNLDKTFSSPAKTLGLGAMSQINPNLGLAAMLASGFWNQK